MAKVEIVFPSLSTVLHLFPSGRDGRPIWTEIVCPEVASLMPIDSLQVRPKGKPSPLCPAVKTLPCKHNSKDCSLCPGRGAEPLGR